MENIFCSRCAEIVERCIFVHFVSFCVFPCVITSWKIQYSTILAFLACYKLTLFLWLGIWGSLLYHLMYSYQCYLMMICYTFDSTFFCRNVQLCSDNQPTTLVISCPILGTSYKIVSDFIRAQNNIVYLYLRIKSIITPIYMIINI